MAEVIEIVGEDFRRMQLLELDMLVELDRVCRKHGIPYTIFGGTLLGAVRHKGYIPWDDDADIAMLREDYERFRSVAHELDPSVCFFQDHKNDKGYRWGYGKLRRTGTEYIRVGQEHLTCKTGVFVDIFPMDDIPLNVPAQFLQDRWCAILRKILWSEVGRLDRSNNALVRSVYTMLSKIDPSMVYRAAEKLERKSSNKSNNMVRTLLFPATGTLYRKNPLCKRYGMPKSWFTDLREYEFEGVKLFGTRDYDAALEYIYGDYMALPPLEKRAQHAPVSSYRF